MTCERLRLASPRLVSVRDLRVSVTCECPRLASPRLVSVHDLRVSTTCEYPLLQSVHDFRVSVTSEGSICGGGDLDAVCVSHPGSGHHL